LNRPQNNLEDDRGDAGGGREARAPEEQDQGEAGSTKQITSELFTIGIFTSKHCRNNFRILRDHFQQRKD